MTNTILDKTDKGREEIATRKYQLAPRLRTLLVMIDGKQSKESLLTKVAGLGLTDENITQLLDSGFIHIIATLPGGAIAPVTAPVAADNPVTTPPSAQAATEKAVTSGVLAAGESQYQALYNFYTETIKSTIGLRGYGLQLKVERAGSINDFRELRDAYLEAVRKAKGNEMEHSLRNRLDELLNINLPSSS